MKTLLLFLFALPALPAVTVIDAGSAADANFSGGLAFTILNAPPGIDPTMRYSAAAALPGTVLPFSYRLPADSRPYKVTLRFIEPTLQAAGGRQFSVAINNQTVIDRMDLYAEAGFMRPLARSFVAVGADGFINVVFTATAGKRNALVSALELEPLATDAPAVHVSDLVDCRLDRQSDTRLVFNAGATADKPCNVRIGNRVLSLVASASIDLPTTSRAGLARFYLRYDQTQPQLNISYSGLEQPRCASGGLACQVVDQPANPIGAYVPLYDWAVTKPGVWDAAGVDRRALLNSDPVSIGDGIELNRAADGSMRVSLFQRPGGVRQLVWCEFITPASPDGSYQLAGQPAYAGLVTAVGPIVFRDGRRMIGGTDFQIDPPNSNRLVPIGAWPSTSEVLTEYWIVVNGGPTNTSSPVIVTPAGTRPLNPAFPPPSDIMRRAMRPGGPPLIPSVQRP